jgi:hypothetical protein
MWCSDEFSIINFFKLFNKKGKQRGAKVMSQLLVMYKCDEKMFID